jgi:hypothetical protein
MAIDRETNLNATNSGWRTSEVFPEKDSRAGAAGSSHRCARDWARHVQRPASNEPKATRLQGS